MKAGSWALNGLWLFGLGSLLLGCKGHGGPGAKGDTTMVTARTTGTEKLPKVVLQELTATAISADEIGGVGSKFCVEVSKSKRFDLICAEDLKHIFQHQEELIAFGSCNQEDCLSKIAEKLQADYLVQGGVSKVGEILVFSVTLFESATGKVKSRLSQEVAAGRPEELLEAAASLAEKLVQEFP